MVPFLKQQNPYQLSAGRKLTAGNSHAFFYFAHFVAHESSCRKPSAILPNTPEVRGYKWELLHLSRYLSPLESTWLRFFFYYYLEKVSGDVWEKPWVVINELDHNQPHLCRITNKHIL